MHDTVHILITCT